MWQPTISLVAHLGGLHDAALEMEPREETEPEQEKSKAQILADGDRRDVVRDHYQTDRHGHCGLNEARRIAANATIAPIRS